MKYTLIAVMALFSGSAFADTYQVDSAASSIEWKAGKKVGSFHNGAVQVKGGTIETDAKGQIKQATVVADMTTISNVDLKDSPDYQKKLVGHLSSGDFFNVEKFPEATFKLSSVTPKSGSKEEQIVKGELTMIGSTQPVEFVAHVHKEGNSLHSDGKLQIERLKWGLKYGSGSIFKSLTADKIINDSFDLTLHLVAKK